MKNYFIISTLLMFLFAGFIPAKAEEPESTTIATFADPSRKSSNPLFKVDFDQMKLTGGWSDTKPGLILEIPCSDYTIENDNAFENAWFRMTDVDILSNGGVSGISPTDGGKIEFFANNTNTDPLLVINFESGSISRYGFGADDMFSAENVTITGSVIPQPLTEETFAFGFANPAKLPGRSNFSYGWTATASFTSSAVIPEPTTICLLAAGSIIFIRRKEVRKRINNV